MGTVLNSAIDRAIEIMINGTMYASPLCLNMSST
jgi:hypothetical protein